MIDRERLANRTYTAEHIEAVTGRQVVPNLVHQWIGRGYLFGYLEPSAGRPRRFKFTQVIGVALLAEIIKVLGVDAKRAAPWANGITKRLTEGDICEFVAIDPTKSAKSDNQLFYVSSETFSEFIDEHKKAWPPALVIFNFKFIVLRVMKKLDEMNETDDRAAAKRRAAEGDEAHP